MNKKKIYVFIFARSGSKGIKNKNLKKIKDKSLLELSINTAKKINPDKIFISSDSKKIEAIAKKIKLILSIDQKNYVQINHQRFYHGSML